MLLPVPPTLYPMWIIPPPPLLKVFELALARLTVSASALLVSLILFSQVFAKFLHNYPPFFQGSVLESGLLSIPLLFERVDGRPAAGAGRDGEGTQGRDHDYFYVLGTPGP